MRAETTEIVATWTTQTLQPHLVTNSSWLWVKSPRTSWTTVSAPKTSQVVFSLQSIKKIIESWNTGSLPTTQHSEANTKILSNSEMARLLHIQGHQTCQTLALSKLDLFQDLQIKSWCQPNMKVVKFKAQAAQRFDHSLERIDFQRWLTPLQLHSWERESSQQKAIKVKIQS